MLDHLGDLVMYTLHNFPWLRRILLFAILAAAVFGGAATFKGIAVWTAIFLVFEVSGLIFPPDSKT